MPSLAALDRHKRRAEYVLHMVYSSPFSICTQLPSFQSYGWTVNTEGAVTLDWDDELFPTLLEPIKDVLANEVHFNL